MLRPTSNTPLMALLLATAIVGLMPSPCVTAASVPSSMAAAAAAERQSNIGDHGDTFEDDMASDDGILREPEYQSLVENDDQLADAMTRWYLTHQQTRLNGNPVPHSGDASSSAGYDRRLSAEAEKRFSEFLGGRRKRFSEFLGGKKRFSEFLGGKKRFSEFLGGKKRFSEFLGGK